MKIILSTLALSFVCCCFIACSSDDQQNGTDQSAPNTLESLLNPGGNSTSTATVAPAASSGSVSIADMWVLTAVNSEQKYNVNLVNNIPVLELDSAKKTMSGHTGCNSLSSKLRVQGNKLLFDSVRITSNQACNDKGFEKKLVSSFKSGNTTYRVANDSLFLSIGGAELVYRRIRRGG